MTEQSNVLNLADPQGGSGYVVASKLLGPRWGLTSGYALLVDYVLTITVSIAVASSVTLMPAILSLLGRGVNRFAVRRLGSGTVNERGPWARLARAVMRRPSTRSVQARNSISACSGVGRR